MEEWQISQLKWYLSLEQQIALINLRIGVVSSNYYATHTFTGSSIYILDSNDYQRAKSTYYHVEKIIGEEKALIIQKNKLIRKRNIFNEELSQKEQESLRSDLFADLELLEKACNWIDELDYYFTAISQAYSDKYVGETFKPSEEMLSILDQQEEELFEYFGL